MFRYFRSLLTPCHLSALDLLHMLFNMNYDTVEELTDIIHHNAQFFVRQGYCCLECEVIIERSAKGLCVGDCVHSMLHSENAPQRLCGPLRGVQQFSGIGSRICLFRSVTTP